MVYVEKAVAMDLAKLWDSEVLPCEEKAGRVPDMGDIRVMIRCLRDMYMYSHPHCWAWKGRPGASWKRAKQDGRARLKEDSKERPSDTAPSGQNLLEFFQDA